MSRRTHRRSNEDKKAELAGLHERLSDQIATMVEGDAWTAWLNAARSFHRYSVGNQILIMLQMPEATRVAPISTWNKLGRHVIKGQRGAKILRPLTYKAEPENADDELSGNGRYVIRGYTTATVFDVAQTEGDPLPQIGATELTDDVPSGLWESVAALVTNQGYTIDVGPVEGPTYGYASGETKTVKVADRLSDADAFVTLIHELAHILLGHTAPTFDYRTNRRRAEVEAESVAYVIAGMLGIDAAPCSTVYVAGWTGASDPEKIVATVRESAQHVLKTADRIAQKLNIPDPTAPEAPGTGEPADDGPHDTDAPHPEPLMCPECREPAQRHSPDTVNPQCRGEAYSHNDRTPLCPTMTTEGYKPCHPVRRHELAPS